MTKGASAPRLSPAKARFRSPVIAGAAVSLLALAAVSWWITTRPAVLRPLYRIDVRVSSIPLDRGGVIALSPDASRVAVVTRGEDGASRLHTRLLGGDAALEGAEDASGPFFSPDGGWIGFAAGGNLRKMPVDGGPAADLCGVEDLRGAAWSDDGKIIFAPDEDSALFSVPASGGQPTALTTLNPDERTHRWPQLLPGGEAVLFTSHSSSEAGFDDARIELLDLKTGRRKVLRQGGFGPQFVSAPDGSGRLMYTRNGVIYAETFDVSAREPRGDAVPVARGVQSGAEVGPGFALSPSGSLLLLEASPIRASQDPAAASGLVLLVNFSDSLLRKQ